MIAGTLEIFSTFALGEFHSATRGRVVGINSKDILKLCQSLIIVTDFNRTAGQK